MGKNLINELNKIDNFLKILVDAPFPVTIRWSKGQEIDAGCGQLATTFE